MLEKTVESYFVKKISARGFLTLKFLSTIRGVPDRIVFGGGRCFLVELKNGGAGRLSKLQEHMFRRFAAHGFPVAVLRTKAEVDAFMQKIPSDRGFEREVMPCDIQALRVPASGDRMDP